MNTNIKTLVLLVLIFVFRFSATAQYPGAGAAGNRGGQNMNMGHFYGKIIDSVSNKPIDAASVQLIQNKFDTVTKIRKDVIVAGMLTTKKVSGTDFAHSLNAWANVK